MREVFLDTVGLLAVWDETDQWHAAADQAYTELARSRAPVVTTTYVLAECGNAAARRVYRHYPDLLRQQLSTIGMLITPTSEDWDMAWMAYRRGEAGDAGIVDQLSFAVMRRLDITRAFTNDRHFAAAGMEILF